jgi:hypothetical protein
MASVNRVYSALKSLVNKDQRGFVTPSAFNRFASVAQMNLFNKLFEDAALNKRLRQGQVDAGRDKSRVKQANEDLSVFSKLATISLTSGVGDKPSDLARIISVITTSSPAKNVEIVYDEEKIDYILRSTLSAPSTTFPVVLISSDVQVFPTSLTSVKMRYYKQPEGLNPTTGARVALQPTFGYTVVANNDVYSAANSVDFEFPEHYFAELVVEIAKLIGVNLRDQDVYTYAKQEEQTQ